MVGLITQPSCDARMNTVCLTQRLLEPPSRKLMTMQEQHKNTTMTRDAVRRPLLWVTLSEQTHTLDPMCSRTLQPLFTGCGCWSFSCCEHEQPFHTWDSPSTGRRTAPATAEQNNPEVLDNYYDDTQDDLPAADMSSDTPGVADSLPLDCDSTPLCTTQM